VSDLARGDAVLGFARGAVASRVVTDAALLVRKPAALGFEEAAALPLARAVAHYALHGLARLRAGERVLVHSAGGAIGHAAVALARALGAEVTASAGSARKRESLARAGAAHVFDSRGGNSGQAAFASSVAFDVALDLAGDGTPLAALAPGGRYIALDRNGAAPAAPPRAPRNISLHTLDPAGLLAAKPDELAAALRASLAAAPASLEFPVSVFPIAQLGRAVRFMAQSRHTGKVVISLAQRAAARLVPLATHARIASGAAIVIGDDTRFPALAAWIAALSPRELLRLGASDDLEAARAKLGAPLRFVACLIDASADDAAPRAREVAAFAAEQGASLWLVSDANAALTRGAIPLAELAAARRERGEAVSALALDASIAPSAGAFAQLTRIADGDVSACLLHVTAPNAWDAASSALLRELGATNASTASKLASASPEERRAKLRELVAAALAIVLRLGAEARSRIDWHRPLSELGLDSLMGVELHTRIEEAAGLEIPPAVLFAEPHLEAVVERLSASIGGA
jgi:NADPH:quinone reductase-like Zn-dependent oxidoreductase/acyl carrier protein